MKIVINDHRKIFGIQEDFSKLFPSLRIEFLSKTSNQHSSIQNQQFHHSNKRINDCRVIHKKGTLTVSPTMTIAEIEQNLTDTFGLSARIFRKSGHTWTEVPSAEGWTLAEQNNNAKAPLV